MPAVLITIANCALVVVFAGGFITCFRANDRMLKRRRDLGYRFRSFAGFSAYDFMIFLTGMAIMAVSFLGLKTLQ
jgi:hypothetical protein